MMIACHTRGCSKESSTMPAQTRHYYIEYHAACTKSLEASLCLLTCNRLLVGISYIVFRPWCIASSSNHVIFIFWRRFTYRWRSLAICHKLIIKYINESSNSSGITRGPAEHRNHVSIYMSILSLIWLLFAC